MLELNKQTPHFQIYDLVSYINNEKPAYVSTDQYATLRAGIKWGAQCRQEFDSLETQLNPA